MDKKLLEALQAALKIKGLNEGLANYIPVTKEDEIEGAIASFLALAPKTETPTIEQMLLDPGVVKAIDQARTQAVNTNTANLAKKYGFDPTKEPGKVDPPADETPREKALREQMEAMQTTLEGFQKTSTLAQKKAQALALLKDSKIIPDALKVNFESRFNLESDVAFDQQLKSFEDEHTATEQHFKNNGSYSGKPPVSFSDDKPTAEEIDSIVTV